MAEHPSQSVTFRCPRDLYDRLAREASHEERDVSWVIRRALRLYLAQEAAAAAKTSSPSRSAPRRSAPMGDRQAVLNKAKGLG